MKIFIGATSLRPAYGGPAFSVPRLAVALTEAGAYVGLWSADQSSDLLPCRTAVSRLTGSAAEALDCFGQPDILHDNGVWLPHNHQLARLAREREIPRIVSLRGMLEPWAMQHKRWKKRLAWNLYQFRDLRRASCLHTTAEPEAENARALGLGLPICTIPNGVDLPGGCPEFAGPAGNKDKRMGFKTALFLGRIYPVKGLPMLIEAWRRVRPRDWVLQIAGPDEAGHRSDLERAIANAGLDDVVSFLGPVHGERKRATLLAADLFVLPTHSESFGMVVAEALAHGLPILTTTGAP